MASSPSPLHHQLQRLSTFSATPSAAATPPESLLSSFASDPIFSSFLSSSFSASSFSSTALSSSSTAARIEKLQHGLSLLDSHLRHLILSNHLPLLSHLSSLSQSEASLSSLKASLSTLQDSLRSIRSELSDPYIAISTKTRELTNLHSTTLLIQSTIRALRLVSKLRDVVKNFGTGGFDIAKAGQLYFEILGIYGDEELGLEGIEVLDVEVKWVVEVGRELRSEGMKVLERGLEGLNQAEVGRGCLCFLIWGS